MTTLSFEDDGVDVVYEGTEFRMEKALIEEATQKNYQDVTDHEVLQLVEPNPALSGEPRRIGDIVN
jgi:F420-dependent methylenetetrahydromethanopterin dehydrogenase